MCVINYACRTFASCDLDLDLMTLICELDICILKMYLHTENKTFCFLSQNIQKSEHEQDRQTDVTGCTTRPHRSENVYKQCCIDVKSTACCVMNASRCNTQDVTGAVCLPL